MRRFITHVCLVSHQVAPNLLPLLDDALKPEKVILVVTPEMKSRACYLENVIKPMGIAVQMVELQKNADFGHMQELFMGLIAEDSNARIALNVTGGTKWMAIAAQEIFRMDNRSVFYVNLDTDSVFFLPPESPPHKLAQRINLKMYLEAHGYSLTVETGPSGMKPQYRLLCESLVLKVEAWGVAVGQLNALASYAEEKGRLKVKTSELNIKPDARLPALLEEFQVAGILQHDKADTITFLDDEARYFSNGGWLERYINVLLNELKGIGKLQDRPCLNAQVCSPEGSRNEIDVAFMANNHLHLIECKTRNFNAVNAKAAAVDALYKLDSISNLGGLATRSMLVSYREISRGSDLQRARGLKIKVVQGADIARLKSIIQSWIS